MSTPAEEAAKELPPLTLASLPLTFPRIHTITLLHSTPVPHRLPLSPLPCSSLTVRTRTGVEFLRSPFNASATPDPSTPLECGEHPIVYSPDGALLCIPTRTALTLYSTSSFPPRLLHSIPRPSVSHVAFSPLSTFLLSYDRKTATSGENLLLHSTATGARVHSWHWARDVGDLWPLQWTADEAVMALQVSNELQLYRGRHPEQGVVTRLSLPGLTQFCLSPSPSPPYHFAAFVPAKTTGPARITVYGLPAVDEAAPAASASSSPVTPTGLLSRSLYKAEEMSCVWSCNGLHCLCETKTSTDASGKSYYGESHLHVFSVASTPPFTAQVDFAGNGGPVQDFVFHPNGKDFLTIQGYQPTVTTQFSLTPPTCTAVKQYAKASRNLLRCSPSGRFLLLGGFGNLAGDFDLFDTLQFKKVGQGEGRGRGEGGAVVPRQSACGPRCAPALATGG